MDDALKCTKCGAELKMGEGGDSVAGMSGKVMGDEYIESYLLCKKCGFYSKEVFRDRFCNEPEVTLSGPYTEEQVRKDMETVRQCKNPKNERCRCKAHKKF
ncbi:MAG: hypothetical protein RDV41_03890, partial [Planctomycetota bacterium]|nr:hypothetical protein [Planctomycetota bacterium]